MLAFANAHAHTHTRVLHTNIQPSHIVHMTRTSCFQVEKDVFMAGSCPVYERPVGANAGSWHVEKHALLGSVGWLWRRADCMHGGLRAPLRTCNDRGGCQCSSGRRSRAVDTTTCCKQQLALRQVRTC